MHWLQGSHNGTRARGGWVVSALMHLWRLFLHPRKKFSFAFFQQVFQAQFKGLVWVLAESVRDWCDCCFCPLSLASPGKILTILNDPSCSALDSAKWDLRSQHLLLHTQINMWSCWAHTAPTRHKAWQLELLDATFDSHSRLGIFVHNCRGLWGPSLKLSWGCGEATSCG